MRTLPTALAALVLVAVTGCATPKKQPPTAEQVAARPATLLSPDVLVEGPNGDAAAELKQTLRAAVRAELVKAGVNLVDDPAAPHAGTLELTVHVVYFGMDGVTSTATLAVKNGAVPGASFAHSTGTHPGEADAAASAPSRLPASGVAEVGSIEPEFKPQPSFSLEKATSAYPASVGAKLVGALLASPAGSSLTRD